MGSALEATREVAAHDQFVFWVQRLFFLSFFNVNEKKTLLQLVLWPLANRLLI
jgi:hypothetical protein